MQTKTSDQIQDMFKEEFPDALGWFESSQGTYEGGEQFIDCNFYPVTDQILEFIEYAYQCGREHALEHRTPRFTKE